MLLKWLSNLWEYVMAKPYKINFLGGSVFLNNVDKDVVEEVKRALAKIEGSTDASTLSGEVPDPIILDEGLTETAVGVHKEKTGQYVLSVLKYNPSNGESSVVSKENIGDNKNVAAGHFKVKVVELNII